MTIRCHHPPNGCCGTGIRPQLCLDIGRIDFPRFFHGVLGGCNDARVFVRERSPCDQRQQSEHVLGDSGVPPGQISAPTSLAATEPTSLADSPNPGLAGSHQRPEMCIDTSAASYMTRHGGRLCLSHGHGQCVGGDGGVDDRHAAVAGLGCHCIRGVGSGGDGDGRGVPLVGAGAHGNRVLARPATVVSIGLCAGHSPRRGHGVADTRRPVNGQMLMALWPQVATIVLLALTAADNPDSGDSQIYLAAGAAVAIAIIRAGVRTLPAPISGESFSEMRAPLRAESEAVPDGARNNSPQCPPSDPS